MWLRFPVKTTHTCDFIKGRTPYMDDVVDVVIATGVLEHVEDDRLFMSEIRRILKRGGVAHIEIPFLQQYHEDPIDCRRLTFPGLRLLLEQMGFEVFDSGVHIGPTVTIMTLTAYWLQLIFQGSSLFTRALGHGAFLLFSTRRVAPPISRPLADR